MRKKLLLSITLICISACWFRGGSSYMMPAIRTIDDVIQLFPKTVTDIQKKSQLAMDRALCDLNTMLQLTTQQRTFDNTIRAYDILNARLHQTGTIIHVLEMVSPDASLRSAAHEQIIKLQEFSVDNLAHNKDVYEAIKEYSQIGKDLDTLTPEEAYYLKELVKGLEKSGLNLPHMTQEELKKLKKELGVLELQFETNINCDNRTINVTHAGLAGLSEQFIETLKKTDGGLYVLGVDYPTVHYVMENCSSETTRKLLWEAYNHRAYPQNSAVLDAVIEKRDTLSKMLGFPSYAALDIDDEMAENPQKVKQFLEDLIVRSQPKVDAEYKEWKQHLPADISLTHDGTIKPWDLAYIKAQYKKKYLSIDEEKIKEYFPMENTVRELLDIYEKFLNITFKQCAIKNVDFWHPDVTLICAYTQSQELIGYLLLDLYPRENKYTHACQITVAPAHTTYNNNLVPAVAVVLANFPKATAQQPALLRRDDVVTFFHEFGHAIHALLGATRMVGFSGTNVKHDFVEMPSQMLEEWMYDPAILKKVSKHYQTGQPLPDTLIDNIKAVKLFDSGDWLQRQIGYALLSLECYKEGAHKNVHALKEKIFKRLRTNMMFVTDEYSEASFGHLMGYGAKYYSYLWSKVFALDLFDHIKKHGLLNPQIGVRYATTILAPGGSREPQYLLHDFLGREPSTAAFFNDFGI